MTNGTGLDSTIIAFFANTLIVVTMVSGVALGMARVLFRRNPSARHFVCLAGIVSVLCSPAIVVGVASTNFGFEALRMTWPSSVASQPRRYVYQANAAVPVLRRKVSAPVIPAASQAAPTAFVWWLVAIWLAGSFYGAFRLVRGFRQAGRCRLMAKLIDPQLVTGALSGLTQGKRVPIPPIMTSPFARTPMAIGIIQPAVILPEGLAETLTAAQLRHVLAHELTHITLRHGASGLAQRLAALLFWPHPLVRGLCREISMAREEICDNVASQDDGAACYARTLLAVAEGIRCAPHLASGLAFLGPGTSLEGRIAGLLDPRRIRMAELEPTKIWAVSGALAITIMGAAAMRVVAADSRTPLMGTMSGSGAKTQSGATESAEPRQLPAEYEAFQSAFSGRRSIASLPVEVVAPDPFGAVCEINPIEQLNVDIAVDNLPENISCVPPDPARDFDVISPLGRIETDRTSFAADSQRAQLFVNANQADAGSEKVAIDSIITSIGQAQLQVQSGTGGTVEIFTNDSAVPSATQKVIEDAYSASQSQKSEQENTDAGQSVDGGIDMTIDQGAANQAAKTGLDGAISQLEVTQPKLDLAFRQMTVSQVSANPKQWTFVPSVQGNTSETIVKYLVTVPGSRAVIRLKAANGK